MKKTSYVPPCIEVVDFRIEKGFATSDEDPSGATTPEYNEQTW